MSRQTHKLLLRMTAVWLSTFLAAQTFSVYLTDPFGLFLFWQAFLYAAGAALTLSLLLGLRDERQRLFRLALFLLLTSALLFFYSYGNRFSVLAYLFLHKSQYDAVIANVVTASECPPANTNHEQWRIECGPPRRVVFFIPGASLFRWQGIVYDPTGEVLKFSSDHLRVQFGSEPMFAEHLYGHWYFCRFTS